MFFYLSKIIWFLAQPLNLAIFLLAFSLLVALLGWRKLGGFTALASLLILVVSAWTSLGALMLNPLEERFPRPPLPDEVAGIIVLTKTEIGAFVVAAWLVCIAVTLILSASYLDVAVRDLVMAVGALTLARLTRIKNEATGNGV